tara:strand:+ start:944 stop:1618 length:675 start_codon:yes stop_codon:yes gene_type:complete
MINYNILKKTNIQEVLEKEKKHNFDFTLQGLLKEFNIKRKNNFKIKLLDKNRIYHINQIKKVCIDYRLRFLDIKYFKNKIPAEASNQIEILEKVHNNSISDFKIMAPSKLFRLIRKDDPLLFAPLGNGYFYLVHKWGNDLKPLRKILMWPLKNIKNLFITIFSLTLILTLITPQNLFTKNPSQSTFWLLYFFNLKAVMFVFFFYAISMGKNFSKFIWNNKYNKS